MTLSLEEDVSTYFFNNRNTSYRKRYTSCYASEAALIDSHNSAKDDQFYFSDF